MLDDDRQFIIKSRSVQVFQFPPVPMLARSHSNCSCRTQLPQYRTGEVV